MPHFAKIHPFAGHSRINRYHVRRAWLAMPLCLALGLVTTLWGIGLIGTAHAATATITSCDGATLDAAISNAASGDTITFGCGGTITLTGTLVISENLTLDGNGHSVTLDGGNSVRVLLVNSGASLHLNALTIAHGTDAGSGGGLYNAGTVTISNSTFANNTASGGYGGGIFNAGGTVSIRDTTFSGNTANSGFGGGLYNQSGTTTITTSTLSGNTAGYGGGGLDNSGSATVSIERSTVSGNTAPDGGGLDNTGGASASVSISTFANNSATGGFGGGIFNQGAAVAIASSTLSGNTAPGGQGGGVYNEGGTAHVGGSIVAGNVGGNCAGGGVASSGNNLEGGTDCGFTGSGDVQTTNPQLGALASNGGPTQTLALLASSAAIDRVPATSCPATDQRGVSRLDNGEGACDVGAYEFVDPVDRDLALSHVPANITVNATSPTGAVVSFTAPIATDESGDDPAATVNCAPASGATFAIGTSTVTCTATDGDDTNSPVSASFMVTVRGAAAQLSDLVTLVNSVGLASGLQTSYDQQLQAVQQDLGASNTAQACVDLTSFISHVQAQAGKAMTAAQAAHLAAAARQIQAVLGC